MNHPIKIPRLLSLDVFRGVTVMLMIIVNSPGNQSSYMHLQHAAWHGCTLADLVFPFFVFIVGVSLTFTLTKAQQQNVPTQQLLCRALKRAALLFFIGLMLNAYPHLFDFTAFRFYGVLQRIALCYLIVAVLWLTTSLRTQINVTLLLLIGYWLALTVVACPGHDANDLSPAGNLTAFIDRSLFSPHHLYGKTFDPEGLLSTFPAIASTLLGSLTGSWLLSSYSVKQKLLGMHGLAVVSLMSGWLWGLWFPINKTLWTSSYVLWTAGLALFFLAFFYWLIELKNYKKGYQLFLIFGTNAMFAYCLHVFLLKTQTAIKILMVDGSTINLKNWITQFLFGWASAKNASLLYALSYTAFCLFILMAYSYCRNRQMRVTRSI